MRSGRRIIVPAIGLGLLLAGCSGSSASSSATSGTGLGVAQPASAPSAAGSAVAGSGAAKSAPGTANGVTTVHLSPASVLYTAQLTVQARDVTAATDQATQVAQAAGGYVSAESAASGAGATASVTLKIPVDVYPQTLKQLATGLGKRLSLQQQAQDVTQHVTDVNSQIASYQAAIGQLRSLLSHAGSISDLLDVQNQINSEETGLEQLESEQRSLAQQTSYATVTLTVVPAPVVAPPVHHKAAGTPGLTGGLRGGWHVLRVTVSWTLTVLGALAPFLAIAAVAAFAALRARRWLLRRRTA
jgi:hypothetical protein